MKRLLIPSSAVLWGLHSSFLSPVLALILVDLYGASTSDVGWVLAVYNVSGFVFSLLIPAYADRRGNYLGPMLTCGALTLLLAAVLGVATGLPMATAALIVVGAPAGVGSSMLYAHLRHSGARTTDIVNARAIFSAAWAAGPPLAALIIGWFGTRAILIAIASVAVLSITTTSVMLRRSRAHDQSVPAPNEAPGAGVSKASQPVSRFGIGLIMAAFTLLQAANVTGMTIMTVYTAETLRLEIIWAGIALGVAAALEVPALLLIGRINERYSPLGLIATSCLAGIGYFTGLVFVSDPVMLIGLQLLNAWAYAGIAGIGLTLFQQLIPRPGLSTGLFMNTRRIGSIVSGPIIAVGALTSLGQRAIFLTCAAVTILGLSMVAISYWTSTRRRMTS